MNGKDFNINPADRYIISGAHLGRLMAIINEIPGRFALPLNATLFDIVRAGPLPAQTPATEPERHDDESTAGMG